MATSTLNLTGPGAIYHRVSTDKQDADRQRQATGEWLARHGVDVATDRIYEDVGWSRSEAHRRPEFQRLLGDVEAGRVKWIVVDMQDRFGTADKFELFSYLHTLRRHRCRLFTVNDKEVTSNETADSLVTHLNADQSERELRDKSERVLEGMRQRAKRGQWMGGRVPYGFDVVAFRMGRDGNMSEMWRVQIVGPDLRVKIDKESGSRREYEGKDNFPVTEADEVLQLRPSLDARQHDAVRTVFQQFLDESTNRNVIARQLNEQGVQPPAYSDSWRYWHIREMLRNPAYIGQPAWNKNTHGDYTEWRDGRRHMKEPNTPGREHDQKDWIIPDAPLFPPIVDPEVWAQVQAKIDAEPEQRRAPKSHDLWFSGIVFCAGCGKPMNGKMAATKGGAKQAIYICSTYANHTGPRAKCPCKINSVTHDTVEAYVTAYLEQTGEQVADLTAATRGAENVRIEAFKDAVRRARQAHEAMVRRVIPGSRYSIDEMANRFVELTLGTAKPTNQEVALQAAYRKLFDDEQGELVHRLDQLEAEHSKVARSLPEAPTERSKRKLAEYLAEIEADIEDIEYRLNDAGEQWQGAVEDAKRIGQEWADAIEAIETEVSARRKAEAIRKVISRIHLTFEATGKQRPASVLRFLDFDLVSPQFPAALLPDLPKPEVGSGSRSL